MVKCQFCGYPITITTDNTCPRCKAIIPMDQPRGIPTTKLIAGDEWDKMAEIIAQLIAGIDEACGESPCDYTCPRCVLFKAKNAAEDLHKLMEVMG